MTFLGIDLGTTYSAMASLGRDGLPLIIPNSEGDLTTPSVVMIENETEIIVGRQAQRMRQTEPARIAQDFKRFMGDDLYPQLVDGRSYSPTVLSSFVLRKLKQDALVRMPGLVKVVITVPAYFDEGRRQATANAGMLAGLEVVDLINEPTAAALAYAYEKYFDHTDKVQDAASFSKVKFEPGTNVIYDLGGGTFDVSVVRQEDKHIQVLATAGDMHLGGRDWDERLAEYMAKKFEAAHDIDLRQDPSGWQHLLAVAEDLKKELSVRQRARFSIGHHGHQLAGQLDRTEFELLTADLLFRTESRLNRVLKEASLSWNQVDKVLMLGGSSRMLQVLSMIRKTTKLEPDISMSPDEAVARGAAIHAAMCLAGTASSVKHKASSGQKKTSASSEADITSPAKNDLLSRLSSKTISVLRSLRTTNVNAHSLGVIAGTRSGKNHVSHMIPRNTALPAKISRCFGTQMINQRRVAIKIMEGESDNPDNCILVGICHIFDLPQNLPVGSPVEVTFTYDSSGRLHVEAVHLASGAWAEAKIERQSGINPDKMHLSVDLMSRISIT